MRTKCPILRRVVYRARRTSFFFLFMHILFPFGRAFNLHFRTKDTRRGKYQNSTVEFECTTKKEQNAYKKKKKVISN